MDMGLDLGLSGGSIGNRLDLGLVNEKLDTGLDLGLVGESVGNRLDLGLANEKWTLA
jgi:hypothetical protein